MRKAYFLLVLAFFLCGCSGESVSTLPTDETTIGIPETTSTAPVQTQFVNPEWKGCEVITPEEGVLILRENTVLEDTVVEGDVYITANAEVTFEHVWVKGNLYVHGRLICTRKICAFRLYAYKVGDILCSAFDGVHGEVMAVDSNGNAIPIDSNEVDAVYFPSTITEKALNYAFATWGKEERKAPPVTENLKSPEIHNDPATVRILSEKQTLVEERIRGDVYITSTGDITFVNTYVYGDVYVAGKLDFANTGTSYGSCSKIYGNIYAYDFVGTCDTFDGTHGQVTGGPVRCNGYMVADDALDYAFDTWGKQ